MPFDGEAWAREVADLVKGFVEREVAPLKAENRALEQRIAELEARPAPEKGEKGDDGVSPEPEAVAAALLPIAEEMIGTAVANAVAELPPPKQGEPGEPGEPGKDVDPALVTEMVAVEVAKAVAALPPPKDGQAGKDAAGIVEALKDSGELVLTLQDGRLIRTGIRDGEKGQDGRDGFQLEDFDAQVREDDRTIEFKFVGGEYEHSVTMKWPTALYRGVFKEGQEYERGDMVTWGGSLWHCDAPTTDKPGTESWTLAAKKGRDGKDGKNA